MATRRWHGTSANVKQITTITVANTWTAGDTATVTIDTVAFVITIGTLVTTAQVATTIYQALSGTTFTDTTASCTIAVADGGASLIPQFSEFTATNATASVCTLTGGTVSSPSALAGKPFTVSVTESTASTGTATGATATTPTSQFHFDQADNWSGNTVPTDNDTVVFDDGSVDLRYLLTASAQFLVLTKTKGYSGNVGLAETNTDNSAKPYHEYRTPTYLTTDDNSVTTTAHLETGTGPGSGRFKWDAGAGQVLLTIYGQGRRAETGVPCTLWKGSHASNVVNNLAGDLGIAFFAGETAVVATLRTGDGPSSAASTICSSGVTLTTVLCNGGKLFTDSAMTTATQNAGEWSHTSGTVTTANVLGGKCYPLGGATWTTLTVGSGGEFNTTKGTTTFTITNTVQLYAGAKFIDPAGRAGNVVFKLNNCRLEDVTIQLAANKTFTLS
jgi:hypothetical protein